MTSFFRKVMTGLALLVVGGLVIGGTMALASDQASTGVVVSSSSDSQTPSIGGSVDDDGTADQGPGDVPVNGDQVSNDDDGTPDQGPGDFPFGDDEFGDDDHGHDGGDDDNSGPSENSGPGSDDSGHGSDDSGHGSD